jgi:importin subunit beta-1
VLSGKFSPLHHLTSQTSHSNTKCTSDLADAYPNGELVDAFRQDWLTSMIKETKTNRDFSPRTIETARWAREQLKRQLGGSQTVMS